MLHIKYRPNHWNQVVGNLDTVNYLKTVIDNPERPHSYLMTGPSGCGKTTLARILAAELGCAGSDFTEIDVGDYRGIDSVREIRQAMSLTPMVSSCRVWLLDECHRLTSDAQAALLKALEDAPKYAYFILATTDPKKLLPTILNRCTPCPVKPLTEEEMKRLLTRAARGENRAKDLTQEVVDSIIEVADGAPRAGLVVLEKYLANPDAPIVSLGESSKEIIDLCRLLLKKQSWRTVSKTLQALKGQDAEEIRRAVLGYCAAVLLKGADDPQALALLDIFREPFYNSGWPGVVWACCLSVQKG
jgi:DNA polymerase-3 subunit gamma/tau